MEKSFTLVEILVVTAIIIIFSGMSLTKYNDYTQQQKLKNEAKKLIDVLELAKKKAAASELVVTPFVTPPSYCSDFTGYQVKITPPQNYSLLFGCAAVYTTIQDYILPVNITITSSAVDYNFPPLMKNTNFAANDIYLKNSLDKFVKISVSSIGVISLDETESVTGPTPAPTSGLPTPTSIPPTSGPTLTPTSIPPTSTPTPTITPSCANIHESCSNKACCGSLRCLFNYCF